jgi:hypothetical protein
MEVEGGRLGDADDHAAIEAALSAFDPWLRQASDPAQV